MPKLIDYPRTSYTGAWELSEVVDDTGGKCTIETTAKKMNRKVSGSFKAIIGSAVKFGLMTSKRELLTTTTLFKRIKHAYDKQEELLFHREAFLTPPLFAQICRKFRNRELPIQMLDVMLMREFGVEEINAQAVAKALVEGCRMCGIIDENNIIGDIDVYNTNRVPQRGLANLTLTTTTRQPETITHVPTPDATTSETEEETQSVSAKAPELPKKQAQPRTNHDAVASLFGFNDTYPIYQPAKPTELSIEPSPIIGNTEPKIGEMAEAPGIEDSNSNPTIPLNQGTSMALAYQLQVIGPGINTNLEISDEADVAIAIALLEKIRRQFRN